MGIKELFQKFAEDKEFAAKYDALNSIDVWLAEAKKDGYSISEEELDAVLQNVANGELSDDEVENAVGGTSIGFPAIRLLPYIPGGNEPKISTLPYKASDDKPKVVLL